MAYLVLTDPEGTEIHRKELTGPLTMGRSLQCDLWLNDPALSREHCRIEQVDQRWFLVDLNSRNGTFVADRPVYERRALEDGDAIRLGSLRGTFCTGAMRAAR